MVSIAIFIAVVYAAALAISSFLSDVWLRQNQKQWLKDRFEAWWFSVVDLRSSKLAVAFADKLDGALNHVFGKRLFSARCFWRSSVFATGLLIASLALAGLFSRQDFGVRPWVAYQQAVDFIKEASEKYLSAQESDAQKKDKEVNELMLLQKQAAERFGSTFWKAVYSVGLFIFLLGLNAGLCFCSFVFSRLMLREIILSGRFFTTVVLLVVNGFLVAIVSSFVLLVLIILSNPKLWVFLPAAYELSSDSIYWPLSMLLGGGVASWIWGEATLKIVVLIALLPCFLAFFITAFTAVAIVWRDRFKKLLSAFLLRCAEKEPLPVIMGSLALIASLLAIVSRLLGH